MILGYCIYTNRSREAVALYLDAFGAELGYHVMNDDGTYFHAEIVRDGQTLLAVSHSEDWTSAGLCTQLSMNFGAENRAALDHAYERLSERGKVMSPIGPCDWNERMCDLVDEFGARWYLAL